MVKYQRPRFYGILSKEGREDQRIAGEVRLSKKRRETGKN
jgi:hypothetical protein